MVKRAPATAVAAVPSPTLSPAPPADATGLRPIGDTAARIAAALPTATQTPTSPTPAPSPSETPTPSPTAVELPVFEPARGAVRGSVEGTRLLLEVPIRSQFDGTEYQGSNCGPASLAMVLDAFGAASQTFQVRNLVNTLSGNYVPEDGTALQSLGWIAAQAGLRMDGLYQGGAYRRWTTAEIREQVRRGHPVITLVKLRELPHFAGSSSPSEHYIVVVGLDGGDFLINDPAMPGATGYRLPVTPAQLERAWAATSVPGQSAAFAATADVRELELPDPVLVVSFGEGMRDDWRHTTPTPTPELVHLEPMVWPEEPVVTPEPPPSPPTATAIPAPAEPSPAPPIPLEKTLPAAPPVTHPEAPADGEGGLGLLSLLSLPLFFLRSAGRLPG